MNGFTLLVLIAFAVGLVLAYRAGTLRARRAIGDGAPPRSLAAPASAVTPVPPPPAAPAAREPTSAASTDMATAAAGDSLAPERFRLVLSYEAEAAMLRRALAGRDAELAQARELREDRHALHGALAAARVETARLRQILVDLENDAPPPLLDGPGAPDDLRLIVGVGPVLERMLQQLGVTTYRQIARWSERDVDEFDALLPEFHGRIRRDGWVTQARELHHSKYGVPPSASRG